MLYLGFNLADSMFDGWCIISRDVLTPERAKELLATPYTSCINPSHPATIKALKTRYGIELEVPEFPPKIKLEKGDQIMLITLRGLPRRRTNFHYQFTDAEVATASIAFSIYTLVSSEV